MFCLNCSDFLVLRFIKTVETFSVKLNLPEKRESRNRTIINSTNIVVSLATVKLENTSRLYFSADANAAKVNKHLSKKSLEKFEVDLSLPKEAFDQAKSTKVVFILYRKRSFFKLTKDTKVRIRGYIIEASLGSAKKITNLDEPVILRYPKSKNIMSVSKTLCVFWNFKSDPNLGGWSEDGCTFQRNDKDNYDECHCNHLTNLAMLMVSSKRHYVCMCSQYVTIIMV